MYSWRNIVSPEYEEISTITRSLHLSQAMDSYFEQRLISHKIVSKTVNLNVKVLWFAPTRPMDENNMYGNVSFTLDWKTAFEDFGPNLYFIDQQHNIKFYYVRVLLTNKNYDFLTPVDDGRLGIPVQLFNNKLYAAPASKGVQYVLEIGVAVDCHEENWLYRNCKIEPNDHSSANTLLYDGGPYNHCICHRFNHFKMECPSPFNLQRTKMVLDECCPPMFCNKPARQSARSRVKKKKTKKQVKGDPSPEKRRAGVLSRESAVHQHGRGHPVPRTHQQDQQDQEMVARAFVASRRWTLSRGQKMVVGASVAALCWSLSTGQKLVAVALVFGCCWPLSMDQKMDVGALVAVLRWSLSEGQNRVVGALVAALYWSLSTGQKLVAVALVTALYMPLSGGQKIVVGASVAALCWSLSTGQKLVAVALVAALCWPLSDGQKMVFGASVAAICWSSSTGQKLVAVALVFGCCWPLSMDQKTVDGAFVAALYWPLSDSQKMVVGALGTVSVWSYLAFWRR